MALAVTDRRIRVQLIEKDAVFHEVLGTWVLGARSSGSPRVSRSGIGCNKDPGDDEVVLRVRVEYKTIYPWWHNGDWTYSSTRTARCS